MTDVIKTVAKAVKDTKNFNLTAKGLTLFQQGQTCFYFVCRSRRDGPIVSVNRISTRKTDEKIFRNMALATFIYDWIIPLTYSRINAPNQREILARNALKIINDLDVEYHPAFGDLAKNVKAEVGKLPTPVDLLKQDMIKPVTKALKRGASRDDLVRVIDEIIVANVMAQ